MSSLFGDRATHTQHYCNPSPAPVQFKTTEVLRAFVSIEKQSAKLVQVGRCKPKNRHLLFLTSSGKGWIFFLLGSDFVDKFEVLVTWRLPRFRFFQFLFLSGRPVFKACLLFLMSSNVYKQVFFSVVPERRSYLSLCFQIPRLRSEVALNLLLFFSAVYFFVFCSRANQNRLSTF